MIKAHLNTTIAYFEEEKIKLEKMIAESVAESEYLIAHHHSRALDRNEWRLRILKTLDDKHYNDKSFKQECIQAFEKMITSGMPNSFITDQLAILKRDLFILDQEPKHDFSSDSGVFEKTLQRLIENAIDSFKLVFRKSDNLYFEFRYDNETLKMSLPSVKQHTKDWKLQNQEIQELQKLGFVLTSNDDVLALDVIGYEVQLLDKMQYLMMKIFFEIFPTWQFQEASYIEITDKKADNG